MDTLANRLHGSTPVDSDTITMPPFFFYMDKQVDTQLGTSGLMACHLCPGGPDRVSAHSLPEGLGKASLLLAPGWNRFGLEFQRSGRVNQPWVQG